jgi:hypothetical protein
MVRLDRARYRQGQFGFNRVCGQNKLLFLKICPYMLEVVPERVAIA